VANESGAYGMGKSLNQSGEGRDLHHGVGQVPQAEGCAKGEDTKA